MSKTPEEETVTRHSRTASASWGSSGSGEWLVPGLTVLYHPDPERMGERAVLAGLVPGATVHLARHTPEFAQPGSTSGGRALAEPYLSRTPLHLSLEGDRLVLDPAGSRTRFEVEARPLEAPWSTSAEVLDQGVVLTLGGRIVLLLHRLDPAVDTLTPRFGLVGESPAMVRLRRDIAQTADLQVPILLRGESGTGKELAARALHDAGPRREGPFIAVNLAAVPQHLAAAELFGAERGAYTGAERRRTGHFERAHGGTLFLDEVGETPPEVQVMLLRALETGEIQAVGGERAMPLDVRVVSATDADLEAAIDADRFRGPLLHRLSGYVVRLPPLRERREDFGRLFLHFLRSELEALGSLHLLGPRPRPWLPVSLLARLAAWHWPGNVRQLGNVVRQMVIANRGAERATRFEEVETLLSQGSPATLTPPRPAPPPPAPGPRRAADLREDEVRAALEAHRFRPAAAADALGIPRSSIYDLIDKIPGLKKAAELTREEIEAARRQVGPSTEAMAMELQVSERALRRRLGELGLT